MSGDDCFPQRIRIPVRDLVIEKSSLDENTDRLNEALRDVEDALHTLHLGVSAEVVMVGGKLRFGKEGAEWVLSAVIQNGEHVTPLLKASRALRLASVEALPSLLVALRQAYAAQNDVVVKATQALKSFADSIRHGTAAGSR